MPTSCKQTALRSQGRPTRWIDDFRPKGHDFASDPNLSILAIRKWLRFAA
jgi:hypothetical protein